MFQADRFRQLRIEHDYTYQQLADLLGVGMKQVWRWENGRDPSTDAVARMAQLFDVSSDYLLGLVESPTYPIIELTEDENRLIAAYRSGDIKAVVRLLAED